GLAGWQKCGLACASGEVPPLTVCMREKDSKSVRRAVIPVDDVLLDDRLPGSGQPLFPLAWASWLIIGVQQETSAVWAATTFQLEEMPGGLVQRRGWSGASPLGPVVGQGRVIWGCRALDQLVPDDLRPGELEQVGAAVTVAEHPPVLPGLVEPAEVAIDYPVLRLVWVAVFGPLVDELPHVVVQRREHLAGHHRPVVGRPTAHDRIHR